MAKQNQKGITTPQGFSAAAGGCGIKASGRPDLAVIVADRPCSAAGLFTAAKLVGAPVLVSRRHLKNGKAQAIICNSGNANAATGKIGQLNAAMMSRLVAEHAPVQQANANLVLPSSTGIIGRQLPMDKIKRGVIKLAQGLTRGPAADAAVAQAIMTTDLSPKQAHRSVKIGPGLGKKVHLAGVCKGSGMIAPNMATMLAFITTDAAISPRMLKTALKRAVSETFNRISVDQHTSPSDMVLVLASGAVDHPMINKPGAGFDRFSRALIDLCADLAYQLVRDGEGATKVFRVAVRGAKNQIDADRVAKAVVNSPLVKTAIHGGDPNWGRIVTAAGYSGAALVPEKLSLQIGPGSPGPQRSAGKRPKPVTVFKRGHPPVINAAMSRALSRIMAGSDIVLTLDLGLGKAATAWLGCDLSRQYITINADYTT